MKLFQSVYDTRTSEKGSLLSISEDGCCRVQFAGGERFVHRKFLRAVAQGGYVIASDEVRICNCAACGSLLLGLSNPKWERLPPLYREISYVAGRVNERPLCKECFESC